MICNDAKHNTMNLCTQCGNQLKRDARFCGKCGKTNFPEVKPLQPQSVAASSICKSCGADIDPGKNFCKACGIPVPAPSPSIHQKVVLQPPVSGIFSTVPQSGALPVKKSKKKAWFIFDFLLVLLAGASVATWFFLKENTIETGTEEIKSPEYTSHPLVNGTTNGETKEISFSVGENASIRLSDSSSVLIPELKSGARIALTKETNTIQTKIPGIETSGYMLSLNVGGGDGIMLAKPVITINKSQVGDINPVTVNIIRVSDKFDSDGNILKDQVDFLPVIIDKSGNYQALDFLLPITVFSKSNQTAANTGIFSNLSQILIPSAHAQGSTISSEIQWIANVKYSIVTFQGGINWLNNPKLIQMTPDPNSDHFRHPSNITERQERKQPIKNIVVLVHGHNEEEKAGNVGTETFDLWDFGYKRDVWNNMYKYYLEEREKSLKADVNKPDDCTVFYEFIYPSYRPIYSPVPVNSKKAIAHRTLGEDLGAALNKELLENNPMVAKMVKENIPFNLFIIGHSMGGLVARAGLRSLDLKLLENFRQLITWGSPHQGSPVTTLRYITAAGFDISIDGIPFYPYGDYPSEIMSDLAMDTPGTRDLRWTNGSKGFEKFFNYDTYFRGNSFTSRLKPERWDLMTGTAFYNENLKLFNESEKFASKFTFLTGNTSKIARVKECNFLLTKAYYLLVKASDCAKGSYIIKLLAGDDAYRNNDGASPVYGQAGQGLWPRPRAVDMGDMDHEEFYEYKGMETAARTFWEMNNSSDCGCPYIADYKLEKEEISATLVWPNDPDPGKRINKIEAILTDKKTKEVIETSTDFSFSDPQGAFTGKLSTTEQDSEIEPQLLLKVTTKEGSVIEYTTGSVNAGFFIGQKYGGGVIFYIDSSGQHGLIAAEKDQGTTVPWGCEGTVIEGTKHTIGSGQANTQFIVNGCSEAGIAGRICDDLVLNGFSDWFLPSFYELKQMFINKSVVGGFDNSILCTYWCSSLSKDNMPYMMTSARTKILAYNKTSKSSHFRVRAIRAF